MSRRLPTFFLLPLAALTALLYVWGKTELDTRRRALPFSLASRVMFLPPAALQLLAGEFKGAMADYLVLETGSYLGLKRRLTESELRDVLYIMRQALALDPHFQQSYQLVQGHIPWLGKVEEANQLLDISRQHRFWDWRPGYFMGFNSYYFLRDPKHAAELFLQTAARHADAPELVAILGARLAARGHDTATAIAMLESMLKNQPDQENELTRRLTAMRGVQRLEKASQLFRKQHGRFPGELTELIEAGLLEHLPANPYDGEFYAIDPTTGHLSFDAVSRKPLLQSRQGAPVPPFAP